MIFGLLYLNAQKFGLIDDSARHHLLSRTRIRFLVVVAALLGLGGYTAFTITCHSKPKCNEVHSYLAFLPVRIFWFYFLKFDFPFLWHWKLEIIFTDRQLYCVTQRFRTFTCSLLILLRLVWKNFTRIIYRYVLLSNSFESNFSFLCDDGSKITRMILSGMVSLALRPHQVSITSGWQLTRTAFWFSFPTIQFWTWWSPRTSWSA